MRAFLIWTVQPVSRRAEGCFPRAPPLLQTHSCNARLSSIYRRRGGEMEKRVVRAACLMALAAALGLSPSIHVAQAVRNDEIPVAQQAALIKKYCVVCHNDVLFVGGMSLEQVDPARPDPSIA